MEAYDIDNEGGTPSPTFTIPSWSYNDDTLVAWLQHLQHAFPFANNVDYIMIWEYGAIYRKKDMKIVISSLPHLAKIKWCDLMLLVHNMEFPFTASRARGPLRRAAAARRSTPGLAQPPPPNGPSSPIVRVDRITGARRAPDEPCNCGVTRQ
jgi:hypothetical protein